MSHIALVIDQTLSPSATTRFVIDADNIVGISEIELPGSPEVPPYASTVTCPVTNTTHSVTRPGVPAVEPRTVVLVSFTSKRDDTIRQVYVENDFDEVSDVKIFGDTLFE